MIIISITHKPRVNQKYNKPKSAQSTCCLFYKHSKLVTAFKDCLDALSVNRLTRLYIAKTQLPTNILCTHFKHTYTLHIHYNFIYVLSCRLIFVQLIFVPSHLARHTYSNCNCFQLSQNKKVCCIALVDQRCSVEVSLDYITLKLGL